jgi:hypothetical protein
LTNSDLLIVPGVPIRFERDIEDFSEGELELGDFMRDLNARVRSEEGQPDTHD